MKRQKPQTFLKFIANNWHLLEELYSYEQFSLPTIRRLVITYSSKGKQSGENDLKNLLEKKYLVKIPESSHYELDDFLKGIIDHLRREYRLGIAEVVRVYVDELDRLVKVVFDAIDKNNKDDLIRNLKNLESHIKEIINNVENNNLAINNIVLKAKMKEKSILLKKRYAEVIDAWERYVNPIGEMLEAEGPFDTILDKLEKDLSQAKHILNSRGAVISEREYVNRISVRVISIRSTLKKHYKYAQEQLKPLYKAYMRNTALTRGATVILEAINKNKFNKYQLGSLIKIVKRKDSSPLPAKLALESFFCNIANYKPQKVIITKRKTPYRKKKTIWGFESVLKRFKSSLPVDDLMNWLLQNIPELESEEYIDYYFQLSHQKDMKSLCEGRGVYETKTHYIHTKKICLQENFNKGVE